MERAVDHRRYAEECVAMAMLAERDGDKALWLTLAQSWARLAEYAARAEMAPASVDDGEEVQAQSADQA